MKRRSFLIRSVLAATGVLLTGIQWVKAQTVQAVRFPKKSEIRTKRPAAGKVICNGIGVADVVVSDGFSVVKTDRNGQFKLTLHADARFVFLSTPAGYEFPHQQFLGAHYFAVEANDAGVVPEVSNIQFELKKLNKKDDQHHFMIWADTQPKNKADIRRFQNETIPDVKKHLAAMPKDALIHGITVGDIVWDAHQLYPDYIAAVQEVKVPFFQCLGNHDMDLNKGGDETSDRTFNHFFGPTYYSFNRGKVHYVVLDDVRYLGKDKEYDGHISNQQLAWLKKDLATVPKEHLLIVCAHIPILKGVKNKDVLVQICKGFKTHIMSGHTHVNYNTLEDGIFEHNHGTVCGALWTGSICGDGTPNGYAWYDVDGTDLKWYYKSTGFDPSYQFNICGSVQKDTGRELLVNVWNHDPEWKVEFFLNGANKGDMVQSPGLDPDAVRLYDGTELPKGRTFVDPKKTQHLFTAPLPPHQVQVRVVVTDRFGNKFTQEKMV